VTRVAAVDCGTNTVKLLVCDIDNTLVGCEAALGIFRRVQIGEGSLADDSAIMTLQVE